MSNTPPRDPARFGASTRLVHAGRDPAAQHGFVNTPIYRGSTVLFPTYDDLQHRRGRYDYGTSGTPTTDSLTGLERTRGRGRHRADAFRARRPHAWR